MGKVATLGLCAITFFASCSGSDLGPGGGGDAGSADADPQPSQLRSGLPRTLAPIVDPADTAQCLADNLAFGVDLYAQMRARHPGNFIYSQTSISLALAMLYAGAANRTAVQMAAALHFTLPPERLHPAFDALDLALTSSSAGSGANDFRLEIANSMWVQSGFGFLPSYLDLLAQDYGAGLFVEDFASAPEAARLDINRWLSAQTARMIPELFDAGAITPATELVLANAVYFHGAWTQVFDPESATGTFHAPAGDVAVPMMSTEKNNATTWTGAGWTAARLPYAGAASMLLLIPDAGTWGSFEQGLSASALTAVLNPSSLTRGNVTLPRFAFETPSPLDDVLQALGMTDAFDPTLADLSAMDGRHDLYVGTVVHKAVIAVDENGTTAAAATGATVVSLALDVPGPRLVVDRPFLFFIRHDPTGAILFQGRVVDPSH